MKIGFEAKRFFTNLTGLGNYSRFVVDALSCHFPENEYFLYSPAIKSFTEVEHILKREHVHPVGMHGLYKSLNLKSIWRSWGVTSESTIKSLDIYHGLSHELPIGLPSSVKKVVTIHDLIYLRFPDFYNAIDIKIYKAKAKSACERADKIIAISQQTADDVVDFLKVDRSRITIVYQGCNSIFNTEATDTAKMEVRKRYNLPQRYILSVGTIERRKNILLLFKALAQMPESSRLPVVVMGQPTQYLEEVKEFIVREKLEHLVTFLHRAHFHDFPAIYQNATLFVYPSLFEGFGIPIVEAIRSKVPVIASIGSCFQEAGGPHTRYVSPQDAAGLAHAITSIVNDEAGRRAMIEGSLKYAERFRSQVVGGDLMRLYQSL